MNYQPIEKIHSSTFDKVQPQIILQILKSITLLVLLITFCISLVIMVYQIFIDAYSNEQQYYNQNAIFGYIKSNLITSPIKNVVFRDLNCDLSEEEVQLFPYGNQNFTYWYGQKMCLTRYKSIALGTTCNTTFYNCGPYCISQSEGTSCPISQIQIIYNENPDEGADQNLDQNRDLYLTRQNSASQFGIFNIETYLQSYPCMNPAYRIDGGLNLTHPITACDALQEDTSYSVRIEQTSLTSLVTDQISVNVTANYNKNAIAYLTARTKIPIINLNCQQVRVDQINQIQSYAKDAEQVGLIYFIIKAIFCGLSVILFIIELIILKGRIINDIRIVTVLLKIILLCLMSFIMIEGGLVLYQSNQKVKIENYFHSQSVCFQNQVKQAFLAFPNLFSTELQIYVQLEIIALIFIGVLLAVTGCLYLVQLFHWCLREKQSKKDRRIPTISMDQNAINIQTNMIISQHTDPYQQVSPKNQITSPRQSSPRQIPRSDPNLVESYQPQQIDLPSQVLSKKNKKY
ncbi:hypothetical protein pb186bvf_014123 [Paramecium bursaria]